MTRRHLGPIAFLLLAACASRDAAGPPPSDSAVVQLSVESLSVGLTLTSALIATRTDAAGAPAPATLSWLSRNTKVVTVDKSGMLTGIAPGTTWIQVSDGKHLDSAFVAVTAGYFTIHAGTDVTCGLTSVRKPLCWGWNAVGAVGDSSNYDAATPVMVRGAPDFNVLSVGAATVCGSGALGLFCWGYNGVGQVGDGTITSRRAPVRIGDTLNINKVALGTGNTTCGFVPDAVPVCWGWNGWGQLLNGSLINSRKPIVLQVPFPVTQIATGGGHVCALDVTGGTWCWGRNDRGQLGDGTTQPSQVVGQVLGAPSFVALTAGIEHTCGRTALGEVWCWGDDRHNQLGTGAYDHSAVPALALQGMRFDTITTTAFHSCGLRAGKAWCWGENQFGQLGNNSAGGTSTDPLPVAGALTFRSISAGLNHSCGVTTNDEAWCWGGNAYGALGDGTQVDRAGPVRVAYQP